MTRWLLVAVVGLLGCGDDQRRVTVDAEPAPAIDAASDACAACGDDQVCVQRFDGVCTEQVVCVDPGELSCAAGTCSAECEALLCPEPYQCENRAPCGTEIDGAFTCYGP